jgi:hypothetical protein
MKNIHRLFATLLFASMFVIGCKDECKDVDCGNGNCVDGACVCDAGYLGADCATVANLKYNGTYASAEICDLNGNRNFPVTVAPKSGSVTEVIFTGLWESPTKAVTAKVGADGGTFQIVKQRIGDTQFSLQTQSGTINTDGKSITLAYKIYFEDSIFQENCTATLTR